VNNQSCNFSLESPDDNDWEAYVGLREKDGEVTLRVPYGYPEDDDVKDKPQILGELTRAVMRFSEAVSDADRSSFDGRPTRDGLLKADGGQSFNLDSQGAALGYTHLDRYLKLIRLLCDPRLLSLIKMPGLTGQFDHRYIARNLERAMYLPDGTPVFDLSWALRTQMRHVGSDMVGLACWMGLDALNQLFPDSSSHEVGAALQSEWDELAHRFADEHELDADASLFSDKRHDTLTLLQTALETCVRLAPPVSSDARELHLLLDELLHYSLSRQDGDIWGLQGFHHVWEAACLEYAIERYGKENIFTCDDEYLPDIDTSFRETWKRNRYLVFAKNGTARRPDLVVKDGDNYRIIDFKYYAKDESETFAGEKRPSISEPPSLPTGDDWTTFKRDYSAFRDGYKAVQDIANIETYRWLLMQYEINPVGRALARHVGLKPDMQLQSIDDEAKVTLELWVPGEEHIPGEKDKKLCWQARDRDGKLLGDSTKFNNLTLIYMPAREIISAYAKRFRLMG
jgi:hypothetical protein